jgi:OOP family OmpA-OmpF porin
MRLSDFTVSWKAAQAPDDSPSEVRDGIAELRDIIVGPEKARIDRLEDRLNDPTGRTEEISHHLAEALILRSGRDDKIGQALEPTIADAIKASVQKKPQVLADALFPLMGPGIRKAISAALMGMIQSFNQVLNHSLSWQGVNWRLEALRTRRPFAEVVLLHSLVYQVEQVFLIHTTTGLVLNHVVAPTVETQDPDLVSGMLTAIQDFIQDSFNVEAGAGIDTLRVGNERSIWVERGGRTTLAAVIRGTPPMDLRIHLRDVLNRLELIKTDDLEAFDGDTAPFADLDDDLHECLQSKLKEAQKRISPWLWLILLLVASLAGLWGYRSYQAHQQWSRFVEDLRQAPGIVVTQAQRRGGEIHLSGLRDALAADPRVLLAAAGFDPERAVVRWEPYFALDPDFVLQRARQALSPPAGVELRLSGDILSIGGTAPHAWIEDARRLAPLVPGIRALETANLQRAEALALEDVLAQIANTTIRFVIGTSEIVPEDEPTLAQAAALGRRAQALAAHLKCPLRIAIIGHTDATGDDRFNRVLSRQRAAKVWQAMLTLGVSPRYLAVKGLGASAPLRPDSSAEHRQGNRRVSFKIVREAD